MDAKAQETIKGHLAFVSSLLMTLLDTLSQPNKLLRTASHVVATSDDHEKLGVFVCSSEIRLHESLHCSFGCLLGSLNFKNSERHSYC